MSHVWYMDPRLYRKHLQSEERKELLLGHGLAVSPAQWSFSRRLSGSVFTFGTLVRGFCADVFDNWV